MKWFKKVSVCLGVLLFLSFGMQAQDPITWVIQEGVTKVIKAVDLQIQRVQTETIWLQEAQKVVENAMSSLDLGEIEDWVEAQKDLYGGYFQELWKVKTAVSAYDRVAQIIARQGQILAGCKRAYGLYGQDGHFTASEIAHMGAVYSGIISASVENLGQLTVVIQSFSTQMSDEGRLAIINRVGDQMDQQFMDLTLFNNQNAELSMDRARDMADYEMVKKMYGL